ncbi:hypothetical protein [Catenuloplanes japonicus]|uniref:hypothetical protein n=1 Tax=Catenuloplanes japonicus TaxID=33876 RepID=UPI000524F8BD|nr:hypothetical protein [Catenuloplanes japonicus]
MDNTEPRHVDRRDQGLRRQRLVTQAAAVGAAILSIAFGWVFAQGSSASAEEKGSTEPAAVETSEQPGEKSSEKPKTDEKQKPETDESPAEDENAQEDDEDEGGAELAPPPAAPEPAPQQESDATTGGS